MSKVECPSCHNHVHPRLWHYSPWYGWFTYMRTQHICNVCGTVMYESGGGLRIGHALVCAMCFAPLAYVIISLAGPGAFAAELSKAMFGMLVYYLIYRACRWLWKKLRSSFSTQQRYSKNEVGSNQSKQGPEAAVDALERLVQLKERGVLTTEEYEREKRKLLA